MTSLLSTRRPRREIGVLLLLLAAVLLAGCGETETPERRETQRAPQVRLLTVETIEHRDLVRASGRIIAHRDATLAAEAAGRVLARLVPEGHEVEEGAVILRVDDRRPRLERDRAQVAAEEARIDPNATAAERRARAMAFALAEDRLARCEVRAPFSGVLDRYAVEIGDWVQLGNPVARLLDESDLRILVGVPAAAARHLGPKDLASLTVKAEGDQSYAATIQRIARAASAQDGLFEVELRLGPSSDLRVGMIATVSLNRREARPLIKLPRRAAFTRYEERFCYLATEESDEAGKKRIVARERRLRLRPLPGQSREWEVREGLSPGDRVILGPFVGVADGVEIREIASEPRAADSGAGQ